MQNPTPKNEATTKPAATADAKAKPAPAPSPRDAQIASVFDSCIPGGMTMQPAQQPPAR